MILLYGILCILLLPVLFLLIPIRYCVIGEMWRAHIRVTFLFGLFSIEKTIPSRKKEEPAAKAEMTEPGDPANSRQEETPRSEAEEEAEKTSRSAPSDETIEEVPGTEEENSPAEDTKRETPNKKKPSLLKQIRFAVHNGTLSEAAEALGKIILHGCPGQWRIYGRFGTGDPATTGMAAGACLAFLPDATSGVEWVYTESALALSCEGKGRVIPLYIAYIVIRLAVSRPVREFWQFRSGKESFSGGSYHER